MESKLLKNLYIHDAVKSLVQPLPIQSKYPQNYGYKKAEGCRQGSKIVRPTFRTDGIDVHVYGGYDGKVARGCWVGSKEEGILGFRCHIGCPLVKVPSTWPLEPHWTWPATPILNSLINNKRNKKEQKRRNAFNSSYRDHRFY